MNNEVDALKSHFHFLRIFALILSVTLWGACEDDALHQITPQIAVDACQEAPLSMGGVVVGGTQNCHLAVGKTDVSVESVKEVMLANPSSVSLNIKSIALRKQERSPFMLEGGIKEIKPGQKVALRVRFRPHSEDEASDELLIYSNASNVPSQKPLEISLSGKGVNNGVPDVEVSPAACDFGRVAIGQAAQCQVVVKNVGNRTLVVDGTDLPKSSLIAAAGSRVPPFGLQGRPPAAGERIEAGGTLVLLFRFTPDLVGAYQQSFNLSTNDPDEQTVKVDLLGEGVLPPVAACQIKLLNNAAYVASSGIKPLDNVILSADGSRAAAVDATVVGYRWTIVKQPTGSTAWLTNAQGQETGFTFSDRVLGVDLAGKYEVRLEVQDSLGSKSVNECVVAFEAIPTDSVHVQLVWDTSFGDMDLHLAKKDLRSRYCASGLNSDGRPGPLSSVCDEVTYTECNYSTCRTHQDAQGPDWDENTSRHSKGDPSLDIDDLSGFGPENINIDKATTGSYLVSVHNFGGGRAAGNTVRIYLFGQLSAEFYRQVSPSEWWEVAIIHWPEGMSGYPCIEDLSSSNVECPMPAL